MSLPVVMSPKMLSPAEILARLTNAQALSVVSIADPSAELNAIAGATKGELRLCYQTAAGTDVWRLYAFDDADSVAAATPFTIAASGSGRWVLIGGAGVAGSFAVQTALTIAGNTAETQNNKGAANGYCPLDASIKIDPSYLPASVTGALIYQGTWNASTNTPTLTSATGTKGHYYTVSADGTTTLDGISDWKIGDTVVFNGTAWEKIDNTDQVQSVHGRQGAVVAAASDYDASQVDNDSTVAGSFVSDALSLLDPVGIVNDGDAGYTQAANTTATAVITGATAGYQGATVEYQMTRGTTLLRVGRVVIGHINAAAKTPSDSGDFESLASMGVTWTSDISGGNLRLLMAVDNASVDAIEMSLTIRWHKVYTP